MTTLHVIAHSPLVTSAWPAACGCWVPTMPCCCAVTRYTPCAVAASRTASCKPPAWLSACSPWMRTYTPARLPTNWPRPWTTQVSSNCRCITTRSTAGYEYAHRWRSDDRPGQDGFLVDLQDWSQAAAEALAAREGIPLTADHWEILELLRQFYQEYQLSPATRPLIKYTALKLARPRAIAHT